MTVSDRYHTPVLLHDSISGLDLKPGGTYVDVTYGGGGHSALILEQLKEGRLIAFDQDVDAKRNLIKDERLSLVQQNFRFLKRNLKSLGISKVDGILADLGVSGHQLDEGKRGFAFKQNGPLDMRMDRSVGRSAKEVLQIYSFEELARMFRVYGEVNNPGKLSEAVIRNRGQKEISTTEDFKEVCLQCAPQKKQSQYLSKAFQAIRIEVNDEMGALEDLLEQSVDVLNEGGRLVVISYHSLEDRMVKRFIRSGNFEGKIEKDFFGKDIRPFKPISAKATKPSEKEIEENPRARSARLRIGERTDEQTKKGKKEN
ncbi:MAG: 16S rRNA (cytosine(1402)-N(4))-methyltransferase RsmH [Flavobacteriales bacterium]|nr:16S rRNA (cytosine(1402)-N(4))-methyltransferase RsmH [Flavobacteriales bacterium]